MGDKWTKVQRFIRFGKMLLPMILPKTGESKTKFTFYFAFPSLNRIFAKDIDEEQSINEKTDNQWK